MMLTVKWKHNTSMRKSFYSPPFTAYDIVLL